MRAGESLKAANQRWQKLEMLRECAQVPTVSHFRSCSGVVMVESGTYVTM